MNRRNREPESDIELEQEPVAPDPIEGVAHKRRNDSPEAVALRMHRERRLLVKRLDSAQSSVEKVQDAVDKHMRACDELSEPTRTILTRLIG